MNVDDQGEEHLVQAQHSLDSNLNDCYYQGKVKGDSTSRVSLDLCDNQVHGAVYTKNGVYSLEGSSESW